MPSSTLHADLSLCLDINPIQNAAATGCCTKKPAASPRGRSRSASRLSAAVTTQQCTSTPTLCQLPPLQSHACCHSASCYPHARMTVHTSIPSGHTVPTLDCSSKNLYVQTPDIIPARIDDNPTRVPPDEEPACRVAALLCPEVLITHAATACCEHSVAPCQECRPHAGTPHLLACAGYMSRGHRLACNRAPCTLTMMQSTHCCSQH